MDIPKTLFATLVKKLSESSFQTVLTDLTEKEGFEPSRRLPDLHP